MKNERKTKPLKMLILSGLLTFSLQRNPVILRAYLPMQNFIKIFSNKSSVVTCPVISPK
jgi:hypothetical protein